MIAEKDISEIKPVEYTSESAGSLPRPKRNSTIFIASDVCLLVGLLLMLIALLLPIGVVTAIETVFALRLVLLITEVSLDVVGAELFVLGFIWPKIT
jgi:hypothetical protein